MGAKTLHEVNPVEDIDRVIHERVRLGIMSCLASRAEITFTELKSILKVTDGNLSVHSRILEDAGYIKVEKTFEDRKPKTTMKLTKAGRGAFDRYLSYLEKMIQRGRK